MTTITLHIEYSTAYLHSEHCRLEVVLPATGAHLPLTSSDAVHWSVSFPLASDAQTVSFWFRVCDAEGCCLREEWHRSPHVLCVGEDTTSFHCRWQEVPADAWLYQPHAVDYATPDVSSADASAVLITLRSPHLRDGECLYLSGASPVLGCWQPSLAVAMREVGECRWAAWLPPSAFTDGAVECKVLASDGEQVRWEEGDNRVLTIQNGERDDARLTFSHPRYAGTMVPVFSLRSEGSAGVGDFGDLAALVDWLSATGQHVLQLLPVNDTSLDGTWHDSYPYSAVSAFALHPLYADLRQLPPLQVSAARRGALERCRRKLNALPQVDYEGAMALKEAWLRQSFREQWHHVKGTRAFRSWYKAQAWWLVPYGAWCELRKRHGTACFDKWGGDAMWHESQRRRWAVIPRELLPERCYAFYVQWVLHGQLAAAHDYAARHGVMLKGDIGIGVSAQACDVWQQPQQFYRNMQAGAPPDYFSARGQCWGFPLYNWTAMQRDDYQWWRRRLKHMAQYFDAFRLDHIIGFCRLWAIPLSTDDGREGHFVPARPLLPPLEGLPTELFVPDMLTPQAWHPRINAHELSQYHNLSPQQRGTFDALYNHYFYHRHDALWQQTAMAKLSALLADTTMLPCGEDLGMVPACVPQLMEQLKILSLELELMPKRQADGEFGNPDHFPYLSVCMPTTHDMAPLRLWWEEEHARAERYYHKALHHNGTFPVALTPQLAKEIVRRYVASPSMLCVIALQDWLATSEQYANDDPKTTRVNDPACNPHYWRYRMPVAIETLLADAHHLQEVRELTKERANG